MTILSTIFLLLRPSDVNSVDKIYMRKDEEMKLKDFTENSK